MEGACTIKTTEYTTVTELVDVVGDIPNGVSIFDSAFIELTVIDTPTSASVLLWDGN